MPRHLRRGLVFAALCLMAAAALPLLGRADDETSGGRKFALLVGVRDYNADELHNLVYTENDVNDLAQLLRDGGYRRVVLLTQSEAVKDRNNRLQPTGKNIRAQLQSLLEECKPDDSVLVAFSGHGVQPHGAKGSFFCPMDAEVADAATLMPLADVYKSLEGSKAGVKVLLVDACRNDPLAAGDKGLPKLNLESVTRPPEEAPPAGIAALFSCSEREQSYESAKHKHGVFFNLVIEGLKGEAANKQGAVTLQGLAAYVTDEAPLDAKDEWGPKAQQHPELVGKLSGSAPLVTRSVRPEITDSIGMKLKLIKPGRFLMGSPMDVEDYSAMEGPQHEVEITQPFYIGVYSVTRGQFGAFVKDDGYQTEAEKAKDRYTWRDQHFTSYSQTDNDPVVDVTWNDAQAFCAWLSKKEGKTYELPTEAEWEYACRAGTTTAFSFPDPKDIGDYAWYSGNSGGHTHPVGQKKANPWGLYDMHGNVDQWCADWYGPYQKGYDKYADESIKGRIARGGSWRADPCYCRSAFRGVLGQGIHSSDSGFRVVLCVAAGPP